MTRSLLVCLLLAARSAPDGLQETKDLAAVLGEGEGGAFLSRVLKLGKGGDSATPSWGAATFSADSKLLATRANNGTVTLWDVATGRHVGSLEGGHHIRASATGKLLFQFSPDGGTLVWAWGHKVTVWDVATRRLILKREGKGVDLPSPWQTVSVSRDGRLLALATEDGVVSFELPSGREVSTPRISGNLVGFGPDGRTLATATQHQVILWDVGTRQPSGPPLEHGAEPTQVCFSPNGRLLAVVTGKGVLKAITGAPKATGFVLWDLVRREPVASELSVDGGLFPTLSFSPDGTQVAVGSRYSPVLLGDTATGRLLARLVNPDKARGWEEHHRAVTVAFSPDGRVLVDARSERAHVWDLTQQTPTLVNQIGPESFGFSNDSKTLAYLWDKGFALWDVASRKQVGMPVRAHVGTNVPPNYARWLLLSPDGRWLATKHRGEILLWDVARIARQTPLVPAPE